jgi:hypothetical protein
MKQNKKIKEEKRRKTMEQPLPDDQLKKPTRIAYVAVIYDGGNRLGIAKEGEAGYYQLKKISDPYPSFPTHGEARECATKANERLGLSVDDVATIVASTMKKP